MMARKYYQCNNMGFHFICAFVEEATGYIDTAELKNENIMGSDLLLEFYSRRSKTNTDYKLFMSSLKRRVRKLKNTMGCLFGDRCQCGLFMVEIDLSHHLCNDSEKIQSIQFLDAALHEQFSILLRRAYRRNYKRRENKMGKTDSASTSIVEGLNVKGRDGALKD